MSDKVYAVPAEWAKRAWVDDAKYKAMYARSVDDPNGFWAEHGKRIDWIRPFTKVKNTDFHAPVSIKWFEDGSLNVSANCLDRHLAKRGDQVAIIWEGDDPSQSKKITYRELHAEVCRFANVLKALGAGKGDRITIYMPMIPEAAVAMLACARIGAIHSVVFGGFSPESLAGRINDCESRLVITADEGRRGGKLVPLKKNVDEALASAHGVEKVLVVKNTGNAVPMKGARDVWWHDEAKKASADCPPIEMGAEDPLFILYTSGSTGKPKGVLHTSGGYLVWVAMTHQYVFDYHDGDIYWCTADVGWVTGHSYIVYGPLQNAATVVMFEGTPNWPENDRFWQIVEKYSVTVFYTAPTAIRACMKWGEMWPQKHDLTSLRLLGSVGESINPEAWMWYHNVIGGGRCPIVDTWWQTETGGIMLTPLPGAIPTKPGSATVPFFGIEPAVLDDDAKEVRAGILAIKQPWPGIMRGIWGDPERFKSTYFSKWGGKYYFPGDGARKDPDGYYWILGRVDDVVNVSAHRIGTAELESVYVEHPSVAESAVVGIPHELKGQALISFVTVKQGKEAGPDLIRELNDLVAKKIGKFALPDKIIFSADLPKTRSGKIMRRLLRDIAEGRALGNVTTLADPSVIESLKEKYATTES